jgi:hypothetical protein
VEFIGVAVAGAGTEPSFLDGCPMFAKAVHGPKTDSSNAVPPCAKDPCPRSQSFCQIAKAFEGAGPHLFRPMYAGANMGHPSREEGSVFCGKTATPMNSTRLANPTRARIRRLVREGGHPGACYSAGLAR